MRFEENFIESNERSHVFNGDYRLLRNVLQFDYLMGRRVDRSIVFPFPPSYVNLFRKTNGFTRGKFDIIEMTGRVFLKTLFVEFSQGEPGNHVSSY